MSDLTDIFDRLRRPFPASSISWRVGSTTEKDGKTLGKPLAYIDARDVMDRLDEIVTPANWQCKYSSQGQTTICSIAVCLDGNWIWKEDGAGDTDYEAEKGALSDAFKRAAVRWGIGRYLYEIKSGWIEVSMRGKTAIIPDEARAKLDTIHDKHIETMEWGARIDRLPYRLLTNTLRMIEVHELSTFEQQNEGDIAGLPVAMRSHLKEHLIRLRSGADYKKGQAA